MIEIIISVIASSAITLVLCRQFLIPAQMETVRKIIIKYHSAEVVPLQELLSTYPDIIEEIHDDIEKLEFTHDLLSSEGQALIDDDHTRRPPIRPFIKPVYATQSDKVDEILKGPK